MALTKWYAGRVEKIARKFHSFAEAEKADCEFYSSLTPQQRLEILFDLIAVQHPHATEQRLERVCRIVKLSED